MEDKNISHLLLTLKKKLMNCFSIYQTYEKAGPVINYSFILKQKFKKSCVHVHVQPKNRRAKSHDHVINKELCVSSVEWILCRF